MNKTPSPDNEVLIRCNDLGKRFCRDLKRSLWYGVQDMACDFLGIEAPADSARPQRPRLRQKEFWAVEGISFEVRRGQCLGLIGKNGAGKTTVLKMLSGIIKPDSGKIELRGRVGGLIALGAGFNPLLTGRENTYVNGAILGFTRRQISSKIEEIEAFAEIGDFMDAPVQGYSSGMSVRLGFAIAAILTKPDVLLLDEVLAVGDMGFTIKCLNAVREMASRSAVIFVSHNMQFVSSFCTDVMVLRNGGVHTLTSDLGEGVRAYMDCFENPVGVTGSGETVVENVKFSLDNGVRLVQEAGWQVDQGACCTIEFDLSFNEWLPSHVVHLQIDDQTTAPVMCFPDLPACLGNRSGNQAQVHYKVPLGKIELNAGRYSLVIAVVDDAMKCLARLQGALTFTVFSDKIRWGTIVRRVESPHVEGRAWGHK